MRRDDKPIYRAEVVGSLLQPDDLLQARAARREGKISAQQLREVEDRAVLDAIALQEDAGLDVLADGEMHREGWAGAQAYLEGFAQLEGVSSSYPANVGQRPMFGGPGGAPLAATQFTGVIARISPRKDGQVGEEFPFLRAHTDKPVKYTTAAPSYYRRYWSDELSPRSGYATCEEFLLDVRDWLRGVAQRLVGEGCDYFQLDAPNYGSLCDQQNHTWHARQGHDTDTEVAFDATLDSSVCDGLNVTSALHVCRGNGAQGSWHSEGGYSALAAQLFANLAVDVALLEYDSDRAGDFAPLALLRPETVAVLGLVTTKESAIEDESVLEARLREAAVTKPLDMLAISTQCGFASAANAPMSEDDERAKLQLVGHLARRVWS